MQQTLVGNPRSVSRWLGASMSATALLLAACGGGGDAAPTPEQALGAASCDSRVNNTFNKLLECVTLEGVRSHQAALQAIADANNGIRTSGTLGYDQSVAYAEQVFRSAGYNVTRQEFQFQTFISLSPSILEQVAPAPAGRLPMTSCRTRAAETSPPRSRRWLRRRPIRPLAAKPQTSPVSRPATSR